MLKDRGVKSVDIPTQIVLKVNETRRLRLKGLGAAGYTWHHSINGPADVIFISLGLTDDKSEDEQTNAPSLDSNIDEEALLMGLNPGHVSAAFALKRPWSHEGPLEEHHLEIFVERT